ncbi:hypothetical protein [Caulobacter henricii]|uniref:Uncharacterized protein n=1 Tax=Caulobacter henricii TaxID=69395 RepID=A0A0P0NXC5_9CAUL|nr:hypothetical protein [Caulobacter henricii]ALL12728.1 hypothetical protein AQ619_04795 [Caulobacter henricii]
MTTAAVEDLVLGPRMISFCRISREGAAAANDHDDEEGSVLMTLRSLASGEVIGWADTDLDGQTARLETHGTDELQVTYELIQLSGAWLIETAKARGLVLFAWGQEPTPVVVPMDVFEL